MTGYAATTQETVAGTVTIEVKSVNSRFLDLQFRLGDDDIRPLEPRLREAISKQVARGKVECRINLSRNANNAQTDRALNQTLIEEVAQNQEIILTKFPQATPLSVNEILRWPGILVDTEISSEVLAKEVQGAANVVIHAFIESRQREGEALTAMLLERVDNMMAIVARIEPLIPNVIAQFKQKAVERMEEALGVVSQDEEIKPNTLSREEAQDRIRQEVALYGVRIDVSEELSRMKAHLNETRAVLNKGGQAGKRLDFMMQELNREANTLGSKSVVKEVADASIELKLYIEQMREQVQNLE